MTEQKIQELKEQGYKIVKFAMGEKEFYLRKPTKAELMIHQDESVKNKGSVSGRSEKFISGLFVGGNAGEFSQYLDEKPLALGSFLEELLKDLGADENFTATEV